jgi:hypothetical protein
MTFYSSHNQDKILEEYVFKGLHLCTFKTPIFYIIFIENI